MISSPAVTITKPLSTAVIPLLAPIQALGQYLDPAILELLNVLADQGIVPSGPMFCYHNRRPTDTFDLVVGFPVAAPFIPAERVLLSSLPTMRVVRTEYTGPYEGLSAAWGELMGWVAAQGLTGTGRFMERYLNNPNLVLDPYAYRTELSYILE